MSRGALFRTLIHTAARFPRTTRVLLAACFVIPFVLGTAYLFATGPSGHASALAEYAYYLGTLIAFVSLWLLLRNLFDDDRIFPIQAFWHTLVVGFIYVVLRSVTLALLPGGFSVSLAPLNPLSAVSASVHTLLAANLIFVLLLRFRRLVLYRRTRKSQWYWRLMLGFMAATATIDILLSILSLETENWPTEPRIITGGIAVIFMAVNCFRLSWIVRLSSKRKALTILLSLLLLSLLVESFLGLFQEYITGPDSLMEGTRYVDYLMAYNSGIGGFIVLGGVFGSLYCLTTILSLLFHLPTTVDFQRGKDEMAAMQSLTSLVKEVFDPDKLASTIAASPVEAGSATSAWLAVADLESGSLKPRILATKNIAAEIVAKIDTAALYREVTRSNKAILLQRALVDRRVQVLPGDGIRSLFVVPLSARNQVLGALFVAKNMESSFENDDLEAVSMYAAQAALALENARLFKEQVESERLARELAIAREVQQKLMPERAPTVEGLSIATSSVTAFEVGGDYHDFAELEDGRLAFIVADVAGKGASAAFYMAELQGAFNALAHIVPGPKDLLRHINRALGSSLEKKRIHHRHLRSTRRRQSGTLRRQGRPLPGRRSTPYRKGPLHALRRYGPRP